MTLILIAESALHVIKLASHLGNPGLRLSKSHGEQRLEAACTRAIDIGARSYTSVNSILQNNLDRKRSEPALAGPAITHPNIRGAGYFH